MSKFDSFSLEMWLHYLETRYQNEIELGLSRIGKVAKQLNLNSFSVPVITVAGTNGKGSTVAALEAIYHEAGYCTAAYTSPHLIAFNERIRLNGQSISDTELCHAFTLIERERRNIPLTYFEMTTLAAFWYFKKNSPDIIILEVGMGGRYDATNIIDSDLAIITTVDLDHQNFLGDSREAIGREKAGILRKNKPFIYADTDPPESVRNEALQLGLPTFYYGEDYAFLIKNHELELHLPNQTRLQIPLPTIYSRMAAAAVVACSCLNHYLPVKEWHFSEALEKLYVPGRQEVVLGDIPLIYDVAHNPQAVRLLADFVQSFRPKGEIHVIFSALKDKDLCGLIRPMSIHAHHWYPALLNGRRAAGVDEMQLAFKQTLQLEFGCFTTPQEAYFNAKLQAKIGDIIVVYGSFHTVNAVMLAHNNLA